MGKPRGTKDMDGASDRGATEGITPHGDTQEGGPSDQPLPDTLQLHLDKVLEAIAASRETLKVGSGGGGYRSPTGGPKKDRGESAGKRIDSEPT